MKWEVYNTRHPMSALFLISVGHVSLSKPRISAIRYHFFTTLFYKNMINPCLFLFNFSPLRPGQMRRMISSLIVVAHL